jgi:rhodanese-related sulfurtransferase
MTTTEIAFSPTVAPASPEYTWIRRLLGGAAIAFIFVLILVASLPAAQSEDPLWKRHVSIDCADSTCLSPRQFITLSQAQSIRQHAGALVVDIRSANEPATPRAGFATDAQVPFLERGMVSGANPIPQARGMQIRIPFGNEVDDALRGSGLRHNQAVILMSPSIHRAILAALLLQERGYSQVMLLND